jgi:hypothetical protein
MTTTAAWCAVKDMLAEAPSDRPYQYRQRLEFLEEKLREQVATNFELQEEIDQWRSVRPDYESPEDLSEKLDEVDSEVQRIEAERDEALTERDSARYATELALHYFSKGDAEGALSVLVEDVSSRPYKKGSNQQDTLDRVAKLEADKTKEWRRVPVRNAKPKGG